MFRYFPSAQHMDADLAACRKALQLAQDLGDAALVAETQVIQGYVRMLKSIHGIAEKVAGRESLDDPARKALQDSYNELAAAGQEVEVNLQTWKNLVAPDDRAPRFQDTLDATRGTITGIRRSLAAFGIKADQ